MSQLINCNNLPTCFQAIYNFLFGLLLFLAFLYFLFGAFKYLLSGASIFSKDEGKRMMRNSLIAVIIVLIIPVILNAINPGIFDVKINIPLIVSSLPTYNFRASPTYLPGTGKVVQRDALGEEIIKQIEKRACGSMQLTPFNEKYGHCSNIISLYSIIQQGTRGLSKLFQISEDLRTKKLNIIREICILESSGISSAVSKVDRCLDGRPFSFGLLQINLAVHRFGFDKDIGDGRQKHIDCDPLEIFEFEGSLNLTYNKESRRYNCKVKNKDLYNSCSEALMNPIINLRVAEDISNGWTDFDQWTTHRFGFKNCLEKFGIFKLVPAH